MKYKIFVSSVQKEFAQQRLDLKAFLLGDAVLRRFVSEVFLFEEIPAKDRRADQVYLEEVERCDIYLGLFGYEYGKEDPQGVSATEREYNHATRLGKTRLIYVWGVDENKRAAKMKKLVSKAGSALIRRRIEDASALTSEVYASLVDYLDTNGALRVPPFDTTACHGAGLKDLSRKRIDWFLEAARRERGFPLKSNTTTQALLTHLNLLDDGKPTNAAILLFGTNPQRFHRNDHPSVPNNPLIAESLYLTRYIERVGSGTQTMIELCREAGLPEPQFEQRSGSFVTTIWRNWLTDKVMAGYNLKDRKRSAILFLKTHGKITNSQYQEEFSVAKRTASLDLAELVATGLIEKAGSTGKGVFYRLAKGATKGQKGQ